MFHFSPEILINFQLRELIWIEAHDKNFCSILNIGLIWPALIKVLFFIIESLLNIHLWAACLDVKAIITKFCVIVVMWDHSLQLPPNYIRQYDIRKRQEHESRQEK